MGSQSKIRDFVAFLSSVRGDLANITAPPYFLAPCSVTDIGTCWNQRPSVFVAPALEADPQKRMLLVLKWVLAAMRAQFYVGGDIDISIKKPLNAFLGELFMASWKDEHGVESHLLSEQVSHHPPITALHMWSEEHGIRATGYRRVEMTFAGAVNIRQIGHAKLYLEKYNETYLIPLPDVKVKGFFSGTLYPEVTGIYYIASSSGLISEINFQGKAFWGSGVKNGLTATVHRSDDVSKTAIFTASGSWADQLSFFDAASGVEIERWDTGAPTARMSLRAVSEQDHWETRKAWDSVLTALRQGDLSTTIAEKSKLEEAQRAMRKKEKAGQQGTVKPLFFIAREGSDVVFDDLASGKGWQLQPEKTKGVWEYVGRYEANKIETPYHGDMTPFG